MWIHSAPLARSSIRRWIKDSFESGTLKGKGFDRCLLFTTIIFYTVTQNTDLVNNEPLILGRTHKARFLSTSGHIFVNRSISKHTLCFCLLYHIYYIYWFINIEGILVAQWLENNWSLSNSYFPYKAHCSTLLFRNTRLQHTPWGNRVGTLGDSDCLSTTGSRANSHVISLNDFFLIRM